MTEHHTLQMDCKATRLTLADTFEAGGLTIRLDWVFRDKPFSRFVTVTPIARRRILDFLLTGAPGPDCCSFCGKPRPEVNWLGEAKASGALICNECVSDLNGHNQPENEK